jgi:hypothetical protein
MRRLAFEVISQSETKSSILVKINKPKKRGSPTASPSGILVTAGSEKD